MWLAIRTELAYFRPWLLGAFAIAAAVITLITLVFAVVPDGPDRATGAGLRGFFPLIAAMVVGFIAQSYFSEERRARLLLAGPLTPRQIAGVAALLPTLLYVLGLTATAALIGVEWTIAGELSAQSFQIVAGVAGMLYAVVQVVFLAQESTAARRQDRSGEAVAGWSLFVVAILLLTSTQFFLGTVEAALAQIAIGLAALVTGWKLYSARTDFTR